jgi:TatD DNase family protein
MGYFDSHAHLGDGRFDADRDQVVARAVDAGVRRAVTCGSDLVSSQLEVRLATHYRSQGAVQVYAAVGVHAHEAASLWRMGGVGSSNAPGIDEKALAELAELAGHPGVVAIGEIGLDYHYELSPRDVQRAVLARQLDLAGDLGLPVILHNRESDHDLRQVVEACEAPLEGVLHCFSGDEPLAAWALGRGFYLGFAFRNLARQSPHLLEIVRQMPLDRLLIETDCPYLAPHPRRGQRNEPAYVPYVAQKVAEIRGLSQEEIARLTTENACRLFGVD